LVQIEFDFTLPTGYVDDAGTVHREGVMRMARALDEVAPFEDGRTGTNEAYLSIVLLSRVVVRIGKISPVSPAVIEQLFASDFAYLQDLFMGLNEQKDRFCETQCPRCGERFGLDLMSESVSQIDVGQKKVGLRA
jgi:hypothetical protein